MQSALALSSAPAPLLMSSASSSIPRSLPLSGAPRFASIRTNALAFNYNSAFSVFPAEACEIIGGEACAAEMYPEVKLQMEAKKQPRMGVEPFEREYLDYAAQSKTVLLGEACDVLGGAFCDQQYQRGIC